MLRAHRVPGMDDRRADAWRRCCAWRPSAAPAPRRSARRLGTLEVGKGADLSLIDWDSVAYPYLDELTPLLDAVIQRAKASAVTTVMCDGEVIYQDGSFTRVDKRRRAEAAARRPVQGAVGRRGGAAQAVQGAAAACAALLRRLHRPVAARALLPAEFPRLSPWPRLCLLVGDAAWRIRRARSGRRRCGRPRRAACARIAASPAPRTRSAAAGPASSSSRTIRRWRRAVHGRARDPARPDELLLRPVPPHAARLARPAAAGRAMDRHRHPARRSGCWRPARSTPC